MFMSFLNSVPLPIFVLLVFAILGFCDCLKKLYTSGSKIEMFTDYKGRLVIFHNNAVQNNNIDHELGDYLLENAMKIYLDSLIKIKIDHPRWGVSTGMIDLISEIVTGDCYNFTETCQKIENMLTLNIGYLKINLKKFGLKLSIRYTL